MKGVLLAGGSGTRLFPLTKGVNKHLLPVGNKPMILFPLEKLVESGVKDVLLITGPEHLTQFAQLLGDGSEWDLNLHFRVQQRPDGIAGALRLAKNFVGEDPFFLILGDNLFGDSLQSLRPYLPLRSDEALVVLKAVEDPERFGIAKLEDHVVVDVVEKPKEPIGNLCVTGIYVYTPSVFKVVWDCKPSKRGELEISDVNRFYAKAGKLKHHVLQQWWVDAGTMEALQEANQRMIRAEA